MRKNKIFKLMSLYAIILGFITIFILSCGNQLKISYAEDLTLETSFDFFADKEIESSGYLYNYDDSADYVYINFANNEGYAIFANETLELMEYSLTGNLPYEKNDSAKKYYGGPNLYFSKNQNKFTNLSNKESLDFTEHDIVDCAQSIRDVFSLKKQNTTKLESKDEVVCRLKSMSKFKTSNTPKDPPLDENNWISPTDDATYIKNSDYFLTNGSSPFHGKNNGTSCTSVAIQLLLSYHNYYNDRRIIAPEYLFGGWNASYDNDIYNPKNYISPEYNPNVCTDPDTKSSRILGSTQAYHDYLYENGVVGWVHDAANNLKPLLDSRNINYSIIEQHTATNVSISSTKLINELDNGYPIVLATASPLNGTEDYGRREFNHAVIAYGYQTFAPYFGDKNSYLGYIVHLGWDNYANGSNINVWTNSSWYYTYMSLHINHTHTYQKFEAYEYGLPQNEYRCTECGHRGSDTVALNFKTTPDKTAEVAGVNFPIEGTLVIPDSYKGLPVTYIGEGAFANQKDLWDITIPASVESIGVSAFDNCTELDYFEVQENSKLKIIDNYAFRNCKLTRIDIPDSVTTIGISAFEGCTEIGGIEFGEESKLNYISDRAFKNCTKLSSISFPKYLYTIGSEAFFGCDFNTLWLNKVNTILERAFADCKSLKKVVSENNVFLSDYAFENCEELISFDCFKGSVSMLSSAFDNCPYVALYLSTECNLGKSASVPIVKDCTFYYDPDRDKQFNSDVEYVVSFVKSSTNPKNIGADGKELIPYRFGYIFNGWFTNEEFTGEAYKDISNAPNGTLYAKWTTISIGECVAEGTLITLADGSQVAVEDLKGDEMLLVWNMFTGKFDSAPILFIDKDERNAYDVINLSFSDGTVVKVISEHAFWDFDLNRYVFLRYDADKYIGHWFNKQTTDASGNLIYTRVQLVGVNVTREVTTAWSPVTYGHLCYYVNGMLSMPGATEGLINIFDVNADTMAYDKEQFEADIEAYGLFTYQEFAELLPVSETVFDAFGGQYLKVAIGKGIVDMDTLASLIERYVPFFEE